jgi:hypothetical protein
MIDFINCKYTLLIILLAAPFSDAFMLARQPCRAVLPLLTIQAVTRNTNEVFDNIDMASDFDISISKRMDELTEIIEDAAFEFDESISELRECNDDLYDLQELFDDDGEENEEKTMRELNESFKRQIREVVESIKDKNKKFDNCTREKLNELNEYIQQETDKLYDAIAVLDELVVAKTMDNKDSVKNETNEDFIDELEKKIDANMNGDKKSLYLRIMRVINKLL